MSDAHKNLLLDLGYEVRMMLEDAGQSLASSTRGSEENRIAFGRALALSEVVSLVQQEAAAFGIPLEDLRLNSVEPESFLARLDKNE